MVVWLFDLQPGEGVTLRFRFPAADARAAAAGLHELGALAAVRRAQAAKQLLDETYPDTQPQDYDQVTWLAGLGARLAALPANFSKEMAA